ncbi:MAG: hypothetical protein ABIQ90_10055 [Polaromonas sp.]
MSKSNCTCAEISRKMTPKEVCMVCQKDIAADDWDALFRAVLDKLSQSVVQLEATNPELPSSHPAVLIKTTVLDCVEALSQLHAALKHDRLLFNESEFQSQSDQL